MENFLHKVSTSVIRPRESNQIRRVRPQRGSDHTAQKGLSAVLLRFLSFQGWSVANCLAWMWNSDHLPESGASPTHPCRAEKEAFLPSIRSKEIGVSINVYMELIKQEKSRSHDLKPSTLTELGGSWGRSNGQSWPCILQRKAQLARVDEFPLKHWVG